MRARLIGAVALLAVATMSTGCVSQIVGTMMHNNAVEQRLVQARFAATERGVQGEVGVKIPLGANAADYVKGWIANWKANPGPMTAATVGEGLVTGAAAALIYNSQKDSNDGEDVITREHATYEISGVSGNITINDGAGYQTTDNSNKSGGE